MPPRSAVLENRKRNVPFLLSLSMRSRRDKDVTRPFSLPLPLRRKIRGDTISFFLYPNDSAAFPPLTPRLDKTFISSLLFSSLPYPSRQQVANSFFFFLFLPKEVAFSSISGIVIRADCVCLPPLLPSLKIVLPSFPSKLTEPVHVRNGLGRIFPFPSPSGQELKLKHGRSLLPRKLRGVPFLPPLISRYRV